MQIRQSERLHAEWSDPAYAVFGNNGQGNLTAWQDTLILLNVGKLTLTALPRAKGEGFAFAWRTGKFGGWINFPDRLQAGDPWEAVVPAPTPVKPATAEEIETATAFRPMLEAVADDLSADVRLGADYGSIHVLLDLGNYQLVQRPIGCSAVSRLPGAQLELHPATKASDVWPGLPPELRILGPSELMARVAVPHNRPATLRFEAE